MLNKFIKKILTLSLSVFIFFIFSNMSFALDPGAADDIINMGDTVAIEGGLDINASVGGIIGVVIKAFLSLLGIIFIILILFAGYHWMTAGGEEEKINKAKSTLNRAVIGLVITVGAYSITYFVFNALSELK